MSDESNDDLEFDDDVEGMKSPRIEDREEFSDREEDGDSVCFCAEILILALV